MHRKSVYGLVFAVLVMLALGIVMLSSTSAFASENKGDPMFFVKRQTVWLVIGLVACIAASIVDYHFWQRTWWIWLAAAVILLALCFVPPIGRRINGSHRWVSFGPLQFQPSELAKLATVVFLGWWYSRKNVAASSVVKGFAIPSIVIGVMMGLIAVEEDLGTTALIGATMFAVMFVAGTSLWVLAPITVAGIGGIFYAAMHMQERLGRLLAFMDLERYKQTDGLQQWQALIAFGSGGVEGLGLGNGRQKMLYLPFAHTDFILPMVGEELGLRATLLIVFCFVIFVLCGTLIALRASDRFGLLLGFGVVTLIALQAAVNIGVTTSLLPNKGFPLPFISYGGTNLVVCLVGVGMLINIYLHGMNEGKGKAAVTLRAKVLPRI
jgi:cell division protein FtsW